MAVTYTFEVGETIRIPLVVTEGDKALATDVRANMKLTVGNKQTPPLSTPPAAVCTILTTDTGWIIEVPAQTTAVLKPGLYVLNTAMEVTGTTIITEPSYVKLNASTVI